MEASSILFANPLHCTVLHIKPGHIECKGGHWTCTVLYLALYLKHFYLLSVDVEIDMKLLNTADNQAIYDRIEIVIISKSLSDSRYHSGTALEFYPM